MCILQFQMSIQKLKIELSKTQRLAEIARPAHLPPLVKKGESKMAVKVGSNSVVYGKRLVSTIDLAFMNNNDRSQTFHKI
jgi:hypothetical protein